MKGKLITLEGTEGSGKSLQARLLSRFLKKLGYKVIITREPGNTRIGKSLRKLLLDPRNAGFDYVTELFLYLADRAQHVKEVIEPYLKKGYIVICDRFIDATVAYQGYGRGFSLALINRLNRLAVKGIVPNLTIILDVPLRLGLKRAIRQGPDGGDRIEREKLQFHRDVRSGYMELARKEPGRIKVIKANKNVNDVQEKIRKLVLKRLTINYKL